MVDSNANAYIPSGAEVNDTHMGGARESGAPQLPKRKAEVPVDIDETVPGFILSTEDEQLPTLYNGFTTTHIGQWWIAHPNIHVAGNGVCIHQ